MAYRILLVKSKREDYQSLYQFMTVEDEEGNVALLEIESKEALDAQVEEMLNGDYGKSDFVVVNVVDYTIDAKNYTDEEETSDDNGGDDPAAGE